MQKTIDGLIVSHSTSAEHIRAVTSSLFSFEGANGIGLQDKHTQFIEGKIEDNASAGVFALIGDVLVGGITYHLSDDWVFLHCGFVWEQFRNRRVYRSLLESIESAAKAKAMSGIWTSTYSFECPALYEKMGFTKGNVLHNCPKGNTSIDYYKEFTESKKEEK